MPRGENWANDPWSDEDLLLALHLREREGLTYREIGRRVGRSPNAVIGALQRVNEATDAAEQDTQERRHG